VDVGVCFSHRALALKGVVREALESVHDNVGVISYDDLELPDEALDVIRGQYDARELIKFLKDKRKKPVIWVIYQDLYVDKKNYVFGQALASEAAVLSNKRLTQDGLVGKEAVHVLGHLLGLRHCTNKCVMENSRKLVDVSDKPREFCPSCRHMVETLLEQTKADGLQK